MRKLLVALMLAVMIVPAAAQTKPMVAQAKLVVEDMIQATGRPIAILERADNDPGEFWYKAAQSLCKATGDGWCEDDVRFLTDTTNQLGWARVFTYVNQKGERKTACALLPPRPGITAGYASTAISGGTAYPFHEVPSDETMETWLWLQHIGSCQNDTGSEVEQKRATIFATIALTLIQGDPQFVGAYDITPSRLLNKMRFPDQARWGTNVGERLLLEHWKRQTATLLKAAGCNVTVDASSDLNTDFIQRDAVLDSNCYDPSNGMNPGKVTDKNLWLWTDQGNPLGATLPPPPHAPFAMFLSRIVAAKYMLDTAAQLANS